MPKDGKIYVKPQSLAQKKMTGYEKVKQETMERNKKIMNALGLKSIPYPFCSNQPTREGKSNVDDDESDEDFQPPENVEGLHFSSDDDEVHGSQKKKKKKQRTVTKKQSHWPVGAMAETLQPVSTTSQLQPSPNIVQTQATTATPPPIVTKKFPRNRAGAMTAILQPSPSKLPPSPFIDQMQPPTANNQPQPPPTVRKKQSRWPVGAMAETLQPVPTTSQLQPSPNIVQAQPTVATTPPIVTKKSTCSRVGAMAATLQPSPSQLPQSPVIDQMQPSTATNQPQPPPIVTQKVPRRPAGAMAGTSQPSPTTSQMPPSQFVDQTQQPKVANQPHAPPSVTTKLPRNPTEAMAATPQPSPTTSQIPPSQFVDQTQPPTTANQPQRPPSLTTKLPRNPARAMAATPQPSPIVSQVQQPPITDQMQTPPPVVSRKRSHCSVESMAASRGRGPSRPYKDWGTGKKLEVVLDEYDLPIGPTAGVLQSQLGILAQKSNLAPLTYTDWRAPQLNPYKERIWDEVKANTNVPDVYKHNCLMSVAKKWKDWKDYLKRNYYDIYETDAERVANYPDRVDPNQWRILVAFWGGQLATERSMRNLANRGSQEMGHTSGRKAHCRVRNELAAANGGVEPDRLEVFQKTHTKKDGKPVDEASKIAIARIDERISQVPVSLQSPTYREEVFTDVLGQDTRGRVRTFGLGPCPSQVWGTRFTRSRELRDRDQLRAEVRKEVLAEVDDRLSRLERKCARFDAHAKDIGYPLPPSPEDDSPISPSHNGILPSHNGQNGSGKSCNEEHVLDANSPQQQNGDDRSRPLRAWTDEELMYEM